MMSTQDPLPVFSQQTAHPLIATERRDEIRPSVEADIATMHEKFTPSVFDSCRRRLNVFLA